MENKRVNTFVGIVIIILGVLALLVSCAPRIYQNREPCVQRIYLPDGREYRFVTTRDHTLDLPYGASVVHSIETDKAVFPYDWRKR